MRHLAVLLLALLPACVSASSVSETGKDTYLVTGSSELSAASAQEVAVKKANLFAEEKGKKMLALASKSGLSTGIGWFRGLQNTYELQFRLVSEDDPEWIRQEARPSASLAVDVTSRNLGEKAKPGLSDQLIKLKGMLDDGVIDEAEYERIKERLIQEYVGS